MYIYGVKRSMTQNTGDFLNAITKVKKWRLDE